MKKGLDVLPRVPGSCAAELFNSQWEMSSTPSEVAGPHSYLDVRLPDGSWDANPPCVAQDSQRHGGSYFCDSRVRVRSLYIDLQQPHQLNYQRLNVIGAGQILPRNMAAPAFTDTVDFEVIENFGWSLAVATAPLSHSDFYYTLAVNAPNAFERFRFKLSETYLLGDSHWGGEPPGGGRGDGVERCA